MKSYGIDQGTTSTKLHELEEDGKFRARAHFTHAQFYPQPQWVEHDPLELLGHVRDAIAATEENSVIGLANQGETVMAWDRDTKRPICRAIVWQDARTEEGIARLKAEGAEAITLARAGLPLDSYFSASKFRWILDHVEEACTLRREGRLRLGTSDAFFLDSLAGIFRTDPSTASRTSLLNLRTQEWDEELLTLFGVPRECLPDIGSSAGTLAEFAQGRRLTASLVDQQAALFGHGCQRPGQAKITFGTGAFALAVMGTVPPENGPRGLLPTIAWRIEGEETVYAVDGGVYNAGSAVDWAQQLGLFGDHAEIARFDGESALARGLVFVPALSGLACPYWDRSAAGMWLGMGLDTSRRDLMQALLEGIALRSAQLIAAIETIVPIEGAVSLDGGLADNPYFLDFLARALDRPLVIPATVDLTAFGAAALARRGAGQPSPPSPPPLRRLDRLPHALSPGYHHIFLDAVARARGWRT
ncbi:MAG TPA: FGGY family carbohydrate kinase [Dongiaceae bacterium]|nr:FGGY family carbohydrate kinase [Dongiaceae bacterium]